jgi:hypothetical protein
MKLTTVEVIIIRIIFVILIIQLIRVLLPSKGKPTGIPNLGDSSQPVTGTKVN